MNVYSKAMGKSMRKLFDTHAEQITANEALSVERIHQIKYLHEFDREFQCATWGYPTYNYISPYQWYGYRPTRYGRGEGLFDFD